MIQLLVCQVCVALSGAVLRFFFVAGAPYPAIIHVNKTARFFHRIFGVVPDFQETKRL